MSICILEMETLRVYRPRVVLHGPAGMGQAYIGAAALHHLEGFHIQTLDLGSLMGDSTRVCNCNVYADLSITNIIFRLSKLELSNCS